MSELLRVLIIEDAPDDAELIVRELQHGEWEVHAVRVDAAHSLEKELSSPWDVVIADYVMPGFSGLEALEILKAHGLDLPFIMVSGKVGEETAVEAMRAGAHDYLLKNNLARLLPAIKRELSEAKLRQEHRRSEKALRDKLDFIQVLIDTLPTPIFYNDPQGRYLGCNKAFELQMGLKREEIIDRSVYDILPDLTALYNKGEQALATQVGTQVFEGSINCARGGRREVIFYSAVFKNSDGGPGGVVGALLDITERKQSELKLRHLSTHDMLTGIYNRAYFDEELERLRRGRKFPVSIVMSDVDRLKEVNDQRGHAEGDALLKRAAQVLKGAFRKEDVVARVGGDEFAALLPNTDERSLAEALDRLKASLAGDNQLHEPHALSLSIGAATAYDGLALIEAWRQADERMYREKKGRARTPFRELRPDESYKRI